MPRTRDGHQISRPLLRRSLENLHRNTLEICTVRAISFVRCIPVAETRIQVETIAFPPDGGDSPLLFFVVVLRDCQRNRGYAHARARASPDRRRRVPRSVPATVCKFVAEAKYLSASPLDGSVSSSFLTPLTTSFGGSQRKHSFNDAPRNRDGSK